MRISGMLTTFNQRGRLTEAGARVGSFTFEGTLFILLAATFAGVIGAMFYLGIKRWFPQSWAWWRKGLLLGLLLFLIDGSILIEGDNFDFGFFGPAVVNLLMYSSIFFWYGLLVAYLVGRFEGKMQITSNQLGLQLAIIVFAAIPLVGLLVGLIGELFDADTSDNPIPGAAIVFTMLAAVVGLLVTASADGEEGPLSVAGTRTAAYAVVGLAALAGLIINVLAFIQIFVGGVR